MLNLLFRTKRSMRRDVLREALNSPDTKAREFIEQRLQVPLHVFTDYNSYLKAGSKDVWACYRACDLTANIVLGATFEFTQKSKTGEDTTEVHNEALDKYLVTPNPYDSWEEMLYMWTFHMKLTGNAYWLKDEINALGQPLHLYPLLPQFVTAVAHPKTKVAKYVYRINGKTLEFSPDELIHFRKPHPSDLIYGLGDVAPSEALYNDYINRAALEEKFLSGGATPSGVMTRKDVESMDDADWGRLKAKYKEEYEGKDNAGKIMFLGGEWTFAKLGLTHQEMESIEKERLTVENIFTNHGVPLSLAGVKDAANYATARQDEINFRKYTVVPLLNLLVGKLNAEKQLVQNFNPQWRLNFNLSGLIDVEQVWKDYGNFYLNGGLSPNELRKLMGLDPHDDPLMDVVYIQQGRVPLEMAGMVQEPGFDDEGSPIEDIEDDDESEEVPPKKPPGSNGNTPPKPPKKPKPVTAPVRQ